jgi:hypothetical protein
MIKLSGRVTDLQTAEQHGSKIQSKGGHVEVSHHKLRRGADGLLLKSKERRN